MFQEGLYQVFVKEKPSTERVTQVTDHEELDNARIHRWFSTVVNTRLLLTGVSCCVVVLLCCCAGDNQSPAWSSDSVFPLRWRRSSAP